MEVLEMVEGIMFCCVSYYCTGCYDHIPDKKQLREGKGLFWLTVQGDILHHGGEGMAAGLGR